MATILELCADAEKAAKAKKLLESWVRTGVPGDYVALLQLCEILDVEKPN